MSSFLTRSLVAAIVLLTFSTTGVAFQGAAGGRPVAPVRPSTGSTRSSKPPTVSGNPTRGATSGTPSKPKPSKAARKAPSALELIVMTNPPGSTVLLNGKPRGVTDSTGAMSVLGLKPGRYTLTIQKPNHRDEQRTITLIGVSNQTETFFLTPLPGRLTVTPTVTGATIEVSNLGTFPDRIADMSLAPSSYQITVSKPGYRAVTREVTISPGQPFVLPVTLEKLTLDEMMKLAIKSFTEGKYSEAIELSKEVLSSNPNLPQPHYLIALSLYVTGNYNDAFSYFTKVISLGGKDVFKVRHRHNAFELCTGMITLTKTTFAFQSSDAFGHDFEVPYDKFKEFYVEIGSEGVLHTKVRIPKPAGRKGEDEKDYNFYVPEALTPASIISCANCRERMEVIKQLMLWVRRQ